MTASAAHASANVACEWITIPFIDVTVGVGEAIEAFHLPLEARLTMLTAISESSSL